MDINIARCIKRQLSAAELLVGIHDYISENIKFEFARCFDCFHRNNALELTCGHRNSQADLFRYLPSFDSGSNKLPGIHYRNLLRGIPPLFGWTFEACSNRLLRKL